MKIIALLGGTGVGKTSIFNILINQHGFFPIKEITTRPKRYYENTSQYVFVANEEFNNMLNKDSLICVCNFPIYTGEVYRYAFNKSFFELLDDDKTYILQANYSNIEELRELLGEKLIDIHITRDMDKAIKGNVERGTDVSEAIDRWKRDFSRYENINAKYVVNNDELSQTILEILNIVEGKHE